jgi:adenylate kinase family enzyme
MDKLIIHISGASGSGKTTLGNKLKEKYKSKIIVKDLDDLLDEHFNDYFRGKTNFTYEDIDEKAYQEYINEYIYKQKKPIIFVGLNDNFIDFYPKRKKIYYNVHAQYKYYIDIDDNIIVKQKCLRFIDGIKNDTFTMENLISNNKQFIKTITIAIETECSKKFIINWINKWKKDYEKQEYKFMSRENIYKSVVKILNKKFVKTIK